MMITTALRDCDVRALRNMQGCKISSQRLPGYQSFTGPFDHHEFGLTVLM